MAEEAKLTGLARHFNSVTMYGRRNVALATISLFASAVLYKKLTKK